MGPPGRGLPGGDTNGGGGPPRMADVELAPLNPGGGGGGIAPASPGGLSLGSTAARFGGGGASWAHGGASCPHGGELERGQPALLPLE